MKIHHYDAITREYIEESEAQSNPLEIGEFLIPANAVIDPIPTEIPEGSIVRRKVDNSEWEIVNDIRGTYYKIVNKEQVIINNLDANLTGLTKNIPENSDDWNNETEQWECNLSVYKYSKKQFIKSQAQSEIMSEYPLFKQININNLQSYTEQNKSDMWIFINNKRIQSDIMEADIDALITKKAIDDYTVTFT